MSIFLMMFLLGIIGSSYLAGPPPLSPQPQTVILDANGDVLNEYATKHLKLGEISPFVKKATVLAEDQHFYEHHGFDYRGMIRAMMKNIQAKRLKEGASTITQQLARNLYLTHEKTWIRKIKEAFFTIRIEIFHNKDDILTAYLNHIYYGHGAYGVEAASQYYFAKHAADLTLAEATMLVGIPKGPTYYSPFNNLENAVNRQHFILDKLLRAGIIFEADVYKAKNEQLHFADQNEHKVATGEYFIDFVWREAEDIFKEEKAILQGKDLTIHTTLQVPLQQTLENNIQEMMATANDLQVGVVSIDPLSGAILQMAGGTNYTDSSFNRVTQAKRMVGSTFKPFLYYAALENGFTATTMLQSEPTAFLHDKEVYQPRNFNGYYAYEPISLAQALALSDNVYAVKTNLFLSPKLVAKTAKQFGISTDLPEVPSLALGSASISLLEMAQAYSMIANGGHSVTPYSIEKVTNQHNKIIYEKKAEQPMQVFNHNKIFILTQLMAGMFDRRLNGYMEVTGSSLIDQLSHEYAGKSGTTETDSWMIGFSAKNVTGVWTGYDNNKPIERLQDKAIAKQLWAKTIERAHQENKERITFSAPSEVTSEIIDIQTGLLATENCPVTKRIFYEKGTEPTRYCTLHSPEQINLVKAPDKPEPFYQKILKFLR